MKPLAALLLFLAFLLTSPVHAATAITMEEFMVPSTDACIDLHVRNKHPTGVAKFACDKILFYVHGATYPSETLDEDLKPNQ